MIAEPTMPANAAAAAAPPPGPRPRRRALKSVIWPEPDGAASFWDFAMVVSARDGAAQAGAAQAGVAQVGVAQVKADVAANVTASAERPRRDKSERTEDRADENDPAGNDADILMAYDIVMACCSRCNRQLME